VSHYKERILNATDPSFLTRKYRSCSIIYLLGELDAIEQKDRCETQHTFQVLNQNHRAKNYFKGLTEFLPMKSTKVSSLAMNFTKFH
jgi:hypothetical protein